MICHYCTYKKDTEASEALTNQRAPCIAWQLCLTIHNFRLLMKAPRTLMTKLPSNCLLKLRPLRLVLCFWTCFTEGGCGGQGDKYYFPDKQYKNVPLAVTTFSTRPCPALCYTTFHPSPNNRLSSSAPDGSIKTKSTALNNYLSSDSIITDRGPGGHSRYHEGGCKTVRLWRPSDITHLCVPARGSLGRSE